LERRRKLREALEGGVGSIALVAIDGGLFRRGRAGDLVRDLHRHRHGEDLVRELRRTLGRGCPLLGGAREFVLAIACTAVAPDDGRPDMIATVLPTCCPCGPSGKPAPRMTSSTSAGSTVGTRRSSSRTHCAAMSSGRARLNEPRNDLARPLRTLATITASRIGVPIVLRRPARFAFPEERGDALARVRMREQTRERGGLGPQPVAEWNATRLTQKRLDHREGMRRLRPERARDRRGRVENLG